MALSSQLALAVDVGATKIAIALVDSEHSIISQREVPSGTNPNLWEELQAAIIELTGSHLHNLRGVGIASAGPIDRITGEISPVNIPGWRNFPLVSNLKELTGSDRVVLHGDAMALANAEHKVGAARTIENFLGIVVSTGIGGGLILNNELYLGESGNVSYFGHHIINFDESIQCGCGRRGCLEQYARGPMMVDRAKKSGWAGSDFKELAVSARSGDAAAIEAIDYGSRALAIGCINILQSLDIHTVVIGGGVAQAGDIYWGPLRKHFINESREIGFLKKIDLIPAQLERDAGLIGAALALA